MDLALRLIMRSAILFGFIRSEVRFGTIFHPGPGAPDGARVVHMEMISLFSCFCSFASIH